jgi:hypothetical protein
MSDDEIDEPTLEGWPTVSLDRLGVHQVTGKEFVELLASGAPDKGAYAVETGAGGAVKPRILRQQRHDQTDGSLYFLDSYLKDTPLDWEAERLVLWNEPCYLAAGSGAVILDDGRILTDTLFPTGQGTVASRVGGSLRAESLAEEMRKAPVAGEGVWAPLLSNGSVVYGHAVAESMVQDSAFHRAGLSPLISYAVTAWLWGAQRMAAARARSPVVKFRSALVKVPRVVFASKLYRHLPLGTEYAKCIQAIKDDLPPAGPWHEPSCGKIYVSRLGVPGRRMTNEAELTDRLAKMGFRIIAGEELAFEEQVYAFRAARLIVGPYGSGLVNAAFAAPDAALCEVRSLNNPHNSPNWDNYYLGLTAMMGLSYGISVTENPPGADSWECSIADVMELVETAADALGSPV